MSIEKIMKSSKSYIGLDVENKQGLHVQSSRATRGVS